MPFIPDNDQERVQLLLELRKENKQTLEKLFATVSEGEHTKVIRAETEGCYIRMEIMLNDQFEIRYYRDDVEVIPEVEETGSNLAELSVFKKLGKWLPVALYTGENGNITSIIDLIPHEYGVNTYGIPSKFIDSGTGDLNEEILLATRTKEILEFISKNMAVA